MKKKLPKRQPRDAYLLNRYGITQAQYDTLYDKQEGRCAVCRRAASQFSIRLSVDHDHKTGDIRGLLCKFCNRYIVGRHRRDSGASLLKAAHEYLTADYPGWLVPERKKKRRKKKRRKK